MENDLISVIVPVYNVEKYLVKCIETILQQTYRNYELILVDDGSTDNSGKICDKYLNEKKVRVIHKENGGLSDARNAGIDIALGKYITFIDSDDFVEDTYLEYLYYLLKKYNTQVSICAYTILTENGKKINYGKNYDEKLMNKEETFERMLKEEGFSVSAWAKLYDISLFKDVRYPKGKLCEDNGTTYKLINKVEYIAYGSNSEYFYLKRNGSIMYSSFNEKKLDMIYLTDEMCDFLEKKYPNLYDVILRRRVYARFNVLRQIPQDFENENLKKDLINYIKKYKKNILFNSKFDTRDKIACVLLLINYKVYLKAWNFYEKIKY